MEAASSTAAAVDTMALGDLGASPLNDGMDIEERQAEVVENCSKRRKEDDFTKELMEGAGQKAVGNYAVTPSPASRSTTVPA